MNSPPSCYSPAMEPVFREIDATLESGELSAFLCAHEWPFHGRRRLTPALVGEMSFAPPSTRSFWIDVEGRHAGLLRVQDLEDIGPGSPILDLRIAPEFRGRGIGRRAVAFAVATVFREYPDAHRIEATTRAENLAMRRVLELCGFRQEGLLRETWRDETGVRWDTALYGLLRSDLAHAGGAS